MMAEMEVWRPVVVLVVEKEDWMLSLAWNNNERGREVPIGRRRLAGDGEGRRRPTGWLMLCGEGWTEYRE
jgi:hypothetical protein